MSLRPRQPIPAIPEATARIARAAFPRGNPCLHPRDRLGTVFDDAGIADLHPTLGQAAEAARGRIDRKYPLNLDLADAGFDHSVLCGFRGRLLGHEAGERLLERLLDAARGLGMLKAHGRQRTHSTHVMAALRTLDRLELPGETLRAAPRRAAPGTGEAGGDAPGVRPRPLPARGPDARAEDRVTLRS